MAAVALCVGAGGTAVAAKLITGKDVRNSSLTGIDIRNKSLTKKDFRGSIRGARGPQGPAGAPGATGATGRRERRVRTAARATARGCDERRDPPGLADELQRGGPRVATAACQQGERAVGGGVNAAAEADNSPLGAAEVIESYPTPSTNGAIPTGWAVAMTNHGRRRHRHRLRHLRLPLTCGTRAGPRGLSRTLVRRQPPSGLEWCNGSGPRGQLPWKEVNHAKGIRSPACSRRARDSGDGFRSARGRTRQRWRPERPVHRSAGHRPANCNSRGGPGDEGSNELPPLKRRWWLHRHLLNFRRERDMRKKMLALGLTVGALTIPATAFADPSFGPGAGQGNGNNAPHENPGTKCHPPGQTSGQARVQVVTTRGGGAGAATRIRSA